MAEISYYHCRSNSRSSWEVSEYGGQWAMAQYIEATEIDDEQARQKVIDEILKYNEEDLGATWAVLCSNW